MLLLYRNRAASNPNIYGSNEVMSNEPFNYIAFSQQLYGEKSQEKPKKPRTVSYVWNKHVWSRFCTIISLK